MQLTVHNLNQTSQNPSNSSTDYATMQPVASGITPRCLCTTVPNYEVRQLLKHDTAAVTIADAAHIQTHMQPTCSSLCGSCWARLT